MCGFIGCINNKPVAISADDKAVFEKMNKFIEHRGQMMKAIFMKIIFQWDFVA